MADLGRQIHNAVQTAVTLAHFNSQLEARDFASVADFSDQFGGATDSVRAARESLRSDDFGAPTDLYGNRKDHRDHRPKENNLKRLGDALHDLSDDDSQNDSPKMTTKSKNGQQDPRNWPSDGDSSEG